MNLKRRPPTNSWLKIIIPTSLKCLRYGLWVRYRHWMKLLILTWLRDKYSERLSWKVIKRYYNVPFLPKAIYFETVTRCCSPCEFCPASVHYDPRPFTLMPEKVFKKVIDELSEYHFRGVIGLWNNNEPLLDKRLEKFVEYVAKRLPNAEIRLLTNGILLTPDRGKRLLDAGVKVLGIDNYSDKCEILLPNVKEFLEKVASRYPDKTIRVLERFPYEKLLNLAGWSPNNRRRVTLRAFCNWPFTSLIVGTDGSVTYCCNDFLFEYSVGNVKEESLLKIWHGERINYIRMHLLQGDRSFNDLCGNCDTIGVSYEDLDNVLDKIILRFVIGLY